MNSGVEFSHAVDQLHEPSVISLLNRTRISAMPGGTSRAPETGSVCTTTGGCASSGSLLESCGAAAGVLSFSNFSSETEAGALHNQKLRQPSPVFTKNSAR